MELVAAQDCLNSAATSFNLFDKSACVGVAPPRIKVALLMIFMSIKRLSEEVIDTLAKGFGDQRLREPAPENQLPPASVQTDEDMRYSTRLAFPSQSPGYRSTGD